VGVDRSAQAVARRCDVAASGGMPEMVRLENTERAVRRFVEKLGGPDGLAVCYEAGAGGYQLHRLLTMIGV
jgi:transposase